MVDNLDYELRANRLFWNMSALDIERELGLPDLSWEELEWLQILPEDAPLKEAISCLQDARKAERADEAAATSKARAREQKARRAAKKAGIENWQGLLDPAVTADDLKRLEALCQTVGWELRVPGTKKQRTAGPRSSAPGGNAIRNNGAERRVFCLTGCRP